MPIVRSAALASTARGYTFALLTAVAIMGLGNTGSGFLLGLAAVACVAVYDTAAAAYDRVVAAALQRRRQGGGGGGGGGWRWALLGDRPRVTAVGGEGGVAAAAADSDRGGPAYGKL
ncbi:hypothetical protein TSOC_009810 [Tetrabaena socialis]|uniref:Uncharacterized protein n=1 Tax=Tetrabaena socialis TaxID=47790 RepID=A0A2J7ZUX8_9CHLO|nr:hypothetical protein TSOC_009810 [Tetrabaena socialis]|eukprot:PNH04074.1 hypothetical protein TSOC_009810 [Tetrabaena socialis]